MIECAGMPRDSAHRARLDLLLQGKCPRLKAQSGRTRGAGQVWQTLTPANLRDAVGKRQGRWRTERTDISCLPPFPRWRLVHFLYRSESWPLCIPHAACLHRCRLHLWRLAALSAKPTPVSTSGQAWATLGQAFTRPGCHPRGPVTRGSGLIFTSRPSCELLLCAHVGTPTRGGPDRPGEGQSVVRG
jgi:hypothetical protein